MNKTSLIAITILILGVFGFVFIMGSSGNPAVVKNVEVKDGIQYVNIDAGGGYSPKVSLAKAGIPTKLIVKTSGSFDCSSLLSIRSVGFEKVLPPTGETEVDVGVPVAGVPLRGPSSIVIYSFFFNF